MVSSTVPMLPAQKVTATPVKTTKSSLLKEMQAQEAVKADVGQNAAVRRARQQTDASTGSASASVAAGRSADLRPASGWQSRVPSEHIMVRTYHSPWSLYLTKVLLPVRSL